MRCLACLRGGAPLVPPRSTNLLRGRPYTSCGVATTSAASPAPRPSWPAPFQPQLYSWPQGVRARQCPSPAVTLAKAGAPRTSHASAGPGWEVCVVGAAALGRPGWALKMPGNGAAPPWLANGAWPGLGEPDSRTMVAPPATPTPTSASRLPSCPRESSPKVYSLPSAPSAMLWSYPAATWTMPRPSSACTRRGAQTQAAASASSSASSGGSVCPSCPAAGQPQAQTPPSTVSASAWPQPADTWVTAAASASASTRSGAGAAVSPGPSPSWPRRLVPQAWSSPCVVTAKPTTPEAARRAMGGKPGIGPGGEWV